MNNAYGASGTAETDLNIIISLLLRDDLLSGHHISVTPLSGGVFSDVFLIENAVSALS